MIIEAFNGLVPWEVHRLEGKREEEGGGGGKEERGWGAGRKVNKDQRELDLGFGLREEMGGRRVGGGKREAAGRRPAVELVAGGWEEVGGDGLYVQGLVRAVGVSNYGPKQLLKIHDYLKSRGVPLCSAQIQFSLLSFGDDQMELKAVCDSLGIQLISYSPLGLGMLTGKYSASKLPRGPRAVLFRQILPRLDRLLDSLREIAQRRDKTMSQVAINWCICKGTIPIPGVKSVRQAEENLGSLGWRLSSDEISELESAARDCPGKMIQNIFQTQ
ncbi:hypothetical protein IEQ34_007582 [Dendrobium chrysotoxum]|uniref:NADP-dependent oxidoreductase domain-containing protein n=1 Tax=Dendrobium chrysotoxum TaxID=161865 RepID=A0AAV7H479_DENCH|nr:hypothetical protein IEQ34_007582 [Dendrobium chrysotoxum]